MLHIDNQDTGPKQTSLNFSQVNKIIGFALIRDIHPQEGVYYLPTTGDNLEQVNCLHLCDNKIFNLSSSQMMQNDF